MARPTDTSTLRSSINSPTPLGGTDVNSSSTLLDEASGDLPIT